jgi:hypothetical protein
MQVVIRSVQMLYLEGKRTRWIQCHYAAIWVEDYIQTPGLALLSLLRHSQWLTATSCGKALLRKPSDEPRPALG